MTYRLRPQATDLLSIHWALPGGVGGKGKLIILIACVAKETEHKEARESANHKNLLGRRGFWVLFMVPKVMLMGRHALQIYKYFSSFNESWMLLIIKNPICTCSVTIIGILLMNTAGSGYWECTPALIDLWTHTEVRHHANNSVLITYCCSQHYQGHSTQGKHGWTWPSLGTHEASLRRQYISAGLKEKEAGVREFRWGIPEEGGCMIKDPETGQKGLFQVR